MEAGSAIRGSEQGDHVVSGVFPEQLVMLVHLISKKSKSGVFRTSNGPILTWDRYDSAMGRDRNIVRMKWRRRHSNIIHILFLYFFIFLN